jgi:hypothetical protein
MNGIVTTGVKMLRPVQRLFPAVLLAGAALLAGPANTQAAFSLQLTLTETGFGSQTILDQAVGLDQDTNVDGIRLENFTYHDFSVSASANVTAIGSQNSGSAQVKLSTVTLTNNAATAKTITLDLLGQNFSAPAGSGVGTTMNLKGSLTVLTEGESATYQSSADGSVVVPFISATGVGSNSGTGNFVRGGSTYSLLGTTTITLAPGHSIDLQASSIASAPAPAGAVLALSGLPILGLGYWFRRRQAGQPPVALA